MESPWKRMEESAWQEVLALIKTRNDQVIVEQMAKRIFHGAMPDLDERGRPFVSTVEDFAYSFLAPFVMGFMKWFLWEVKNSTYQKILFSTRDGFLIQRLYHLMIEKYRLEGMPEDIYFPVSRTLCVAAAVFSEDDIVRYAKVKYAKGPEAMLQRRFNVPKGDILPYDENRYKNVAGYALAHKEKILACSAMVRKNYLHHMEKLGLKNVGTYALYDFVSSGTCQLLLNYICELDLEGLYACRYYPSEGITNYTNAEEKIQLPVKAYVTNHSTTEKETYFFKDYNFMETVFTSCEPSVRSINENGPILDHEQRSEKDLRNIYRIQRIIEDYINDMAGAIDLDEEISFPLIDKILSLKDTQYTREESGLLDHCELIEDFGQGRIKINRN